MTGPLGSSVASGLLARAQRRNPLVGSIAQRLQSTQLNRYVGDALATIQGASNELVAIRNQLKADIKTAWDTAANDRNLNDEGRRNREAELTQAAQDRANQTIADLRTRVYAAEETIEGYAARFKPKPATGVEALLARQASWQRLRQLLDNGRLTARQLIAQTTEPEDLFALRDELPVYAQANGASLETAASLTAAIDAQLAGTAASPDAQAAIAAEQAITLIMPALRVKLGTEQSNVAAGLVYGGNLANAIAAQLAQQQAVATFDWSPNDPGTAGQ